MRIARKALALGGTALIAAATLAATAGAQPAPTRPTPKNWNYEIQNGQRVPKGNRIANPDGSWREELRQGNCVTVKEKSKAGEYKETRQCNPS
jgi:hypothetical protein